MGIPAYFIGLALPVLAGIGLGIFMYKMIQTSEQQNAYGARRRKNSFHEERTEERTTCPICLEYINEYDGHPLPCGHLFHNECRTNLLKRRLKSCPTCRRNIYE